MSDLELLLEKVRTAEAGSLELDGQIFNAVVGVDAHDAKRWYGGGIESHVTTSFDAIVALIERELPGWNIQVFKNDEGWMARLRSPRYDLFCTNVVDGVERRVPSGPLALCAAFLAAKAALEQTGSGETGNE